MPIAVLNPMVVPAIVYDRIFLVRLEITQVMIESDFVPPHYEVTIEYRRYGVVDGKRHYSPVQNEIVIADYFGVAMEKALAGDADMIEALQAIERALAQIIADHDGLVTEVV